MATTTTPAHAADQLDPWGFGRAEDDRSAVVEHAHHPAAPATLAALDARDTDQTAVPFPPFAQRHAAVRPAAQVRAGTREWLAVLAVFAVAVLGQAFYIGLRLSAQAADASMGTLVVSSHPAGLQVFVDGHVAGTTPLAFAAAPGRHHVEVTEPGGVRHSFEADAIAGERWTQHVASGSAGLAWAGGALQIDTIGGTAKVLLDGELIGDAPVSARDVQPGDHTVRLVYTTGDTLDRRITVAAGERLALVVDAGARRSRGGSAVIAARPQASASVAPPPARAAAALPATGTGWVRIDAPFEVEVYEQGRLLGSSGLGSVALSAGGHALELVNEALGYRVVTKAVVLAGKTTTLPVETPRAVVHVNAQPWAEVLVDGTVLGDTPLANVMLPIGHHQLVFRHPELGERTQTFTVRAGGPNRVSADLRR